MNKDIITPDQLEIFITLAHARMMVAILILLGMVAVALGSLSMAFGLKKTGFIFLAAYGGLMSFVGIGFCYIFGPVVLAASIGGFVREWVSASKKPA